ncbi:MAG: hypothetical protein NTV51_03985 [Verrucomicrobia bacterium]|nr:hypothetical protein [Verrucomicrobiota bacterium]
MSGEQSPTAEELEIDRLRADVRHLREAMQSVAFHAGDKTGDKADRLVTCLNIATDTLKRVAT